MDNKLVNNGSKFTTERNGIFYINFSLSNGRLNAIGCTGINCQVTAASHVGTQISPITAQFQTGIGCD
ncbi:Uncharacterised protein [Yersinia pekkanenii]|uniref:Uncharacterized protein n=1 Tax=Yersinia pekkanenii TaxID=1288385 RepID=A0A0T9NH00_9GAMM|nr:Uncharacterised protein [Yersinia pekkanenii]CRY64698.1 Uncharacterised protein [Yersinia pekkanenii]